MRFVVLIIPILNVFQILLVAFFAGFTFLMAIGLCYMMIHFVFVDDTHKIIGTLLTLYCLYLHVSLVFSNPGLAR